MVEGRIPTLTRLPFDTLRPRARRGELAEGTLPNTQLSALHAMRHALCAPLQQSAIRMPKSAIENL